MGRTDARRTGGLALAAVLVGAACGSVAAAGTDRSLASDLARDQVAVTDAAALPDVVAATDRLGLQMLAETPVGGNVVTSPASAVVALAMLAEGSRGATEQDLDTLLGAGGQQRSRAVNALTAALAPLDGDPALVGGDELPPDPLVHVASQVVVDDELDVLPGYLDALGTSYGAGVQQTDLGSGAGGELLDAWVAEHTGGLVQESAVEPDPDLRLVLQSAVALAARWQTPFPAGLTSDRPFTLPDGSTAEVETMENRLDVASAEVSGWQAVRLPYRGGTLHADVLLPPPGVGAGTLDPATLAALDAALDAAPVGDVAVRLPVLALSGTTDLRPVLRRTAPALLAGDADLTGISEQELVLAQASQQAVLALDEDGTTAGAVTEIAAAEAAAGRTVAVDRPFVLRLGAADTGWTLFLARVDDPRPSDD